MKKLTGLTSLIGGAAMMLGISVTQAGTASETIAQVEATLPPQTKHVLSGALSTLPLGEKRFRWPKF